MDKRALRRRKKVIRSSRMPLSRSRVRRASSTDDATCHHTNADATNAQTGTTPHRATERRARRGWPWAHAQSESEPQRWRQRWLLRLLLLLLLRLLWLRRWLGLLRLRLLLWLRLLTGGSPGRCTVDPTRRAESAPSGGCTDTDAGIATDTTI